MWGDSIFRFSIKPVNETIEQSLKRYLLFIDILNEFDNDILCSYKSSHDLLDINYPLIKTFEEYLDLFIKEHRSRMKELDGLDLTPNETVPLGMSIGGAVRDKQNKTTSIIGVSSFNSSLYTTSYVFYFRVYELKIVRDFNWFKSLFILIVNTLNPYHAFFTTRKLNRIKNATFDSPTYHDLSTGVLTYVTNGLLDGVEIPVSFSHEILPNGVLFTPLGNEFLDDKKIGHTEKIDELLNFFHEHNMKDPCWS
jgi:hypothetical protein